MFFVFTKKKWAELMHSIGEMKQGAETSQCQLDQFERNLEEAERKQRQELEQEMEELRVMMRSLLKNQKQQTQSIEDYLEEEQEWMAALEGMRKEQKKGKERETALLSLVCCYQEQMHLLQKQVLSELEDSQDKRIAWENQFEIVSECINRQMRACVMEETGKKGETVDFAIHEVLSVSETKEQTLEGRVEKVFSPGCAYYGRTVKKARVAAYRRIEDGNDYRD